MSSDIQIEYKTLTHYFRYHTFDAENNSTRGIRMIRPTGGASVSTLNKTI